MIIVTHKVIDAIRVATRFLFLQDGRIVFDGDKKGLLGSDNPVIHEFLNEFRCDVNATQPPIREKGKVVSVREKKSIPVKREAVSVKAKRLTPVKKEVASVKGRKLTQAQKIKNKK
jgi:ABC-type multidrug transport system ATPase subunit